VYGKAEPPDHPERPHSAILHGTVPTGSGWTCRSTLAAEKTVLDGLNEGEPKEVRHGGPCQEAQDDRRMARSTILVLCQVLISENCTTTPLELEISSGNSSALC
jgi:hypothetical protein